MMKLFCENDSKLNYMSDKFKLIHRQVKSLTGNDGRRLGGRKADIVVDIGPGRCNLRLKSRNDLRKIGGSNLFNYKTEQDW